MPLCPVAEGSLPSKGKLLSTGQWGSPTLAAASRGCSSTCMTLGWTRGSEALSVLTCKAGAMLSNPRHVALSAPWVSGVSLLIGPACLSLPIYKLG